MENAAKTADICFVLEGTYPYVAGGVSGWVHDLIRNHPEFSFSIAALLAPGADCKMRYELPENVIALTNTTLQDLPLGAKSIPGQKQFFNKAAELLSLMHENMGLAELRKLISLIRPLRSQLGSRILLDSLDAWDLMTAMYRRIFPGGSFLDYFWSWRCLMSGLYSVLLNNIPNAKVYHAVCTGFAGVFTARARIEKNAPCLLTEHGIYTNERRIELSFADWFHDLETHNLLIDDERLELRDYWFGVFKSYSRICYEACDPIITLFDGNKEAQKAEGADPSRLLVIPNGIDYERFSKVSRSEQPRKKTIALIGRAVPIKGVKTYILACNIIKKSIPDFIAYVLGPTDEEPEYFEECCEMIEHFALKENVIFTGGVNLMDYFGKIDILVLSSISEAQPLVILEAGAAGIPAVTTDVGSCRELLFGRLDEEPKLGPGGAVCRVSDAREIAERILHLLTNDDERLQYGRNLQERVRRYYNKVDQHSSYSQVYMKALAEAEKKGQNKDSTTQKAEL